MYQIALLRLILVDSAERRLVPDAILNLACRRVTGGREKSALRRVGCLRAGKENVPGGRGKGLCEGWRGEGTNASLISSVYESVAM